MSAEVKFLIPLKGMIVRDPISIVVPQAILSTEVWLAPKAFVSNAPQAATALQMN